MLSGPCEESNIQTKHRDRNMVTERVRQPEIQPFNHSCGQHMVGSEEGFNAVFSPQIDSFEQFSTVKQPTRLTGYPSTYLLQHLLAFLHHPALTREPLQ
ncbi:hypothetical protein KUCAC02_031888 [Chaenocephalus aceratus]|nr:hypothetical protein KUCAC02_031888 [Chaenocephalus aceratus]